jgi:hypothetical protein
LLSGDAHRPVRFLVPPQARCARRRAAVCCAYAAGAAVRAATPPWAIARQASTTNGCAREWRFSGASPSLPTSINRPEPSLAGASSAQKTRPGASRRNRSFPRGLSVQTVTQMNSTIQDFFPFSFSIFS